MLQRLKICHHGISSACEALGEGCGAVLYRRARAFSGKQGLQCVRFFCYPGSIPLGCVPPAHMEHAAMEEVHGVVSGPQCPGSLSLLRFQLECFSRCAPAATGGASRMGGGFDFSQSDFFFCLSFGSITLFPNFNCLTATVSAARRVRNNTRWICSLFFMTRLEHHVRWVRGSVAILGWLVAALIVEEPRACTH